MEIKDNIVYRPKDWRDPVLVKTVCTAVGEGGEPAIVVYHIHGSDSGIKLYMTRWQFFTHYEEVKP